jgi:hypothetical protein
MYMRVADVRCSSKIVPKHTIAHSAVQLETSGRRIIGGTKIMRGLITSNVRVNTAMEPPNNAMNLTVRPVTRLAYLQPTGGRTLDLGV